MAQYKTSVIIIFTILMTGLFVSDRLQASPVVEEFVQNIDQPFGGSQSPDEARIAAIAKGKAEALERTGTYFESYSLVENFVLEKDESLALTAGVLNTEVISQENYATQLGFGMRLTLKISVDTSILENRFEQIKTDRALLRKYKELQSREAALLARIKELEANTAAAESQQERFAMDKRYRTAVQALPAVELNRQALTYWVDGRFSDPEAAIALLDQALQLDPDNTLTINNRGVALFQLGRRGEALEAFNRAIRHTPEYGDGYSNRGILEMAQQAYLEAETDFSRVIELSPMRVDAYINRAVARKNLWKFEQALDDFQRVLALDPAAVIKQSDAGSVSLDFNELSRICDKASRACTLGLCRGLEDLQEKKLCTQQ